LYFFIFYFALFCIPDVRSRLEGDFNEK
jgi:hypothetical protein